MVGMEMQSGVLTEHRSSRRRQEVLAPAASHWVLDRPGSERKDHEQIEHLLSVAATVT